MAGAKCPRLGKTRGAFPQRLALYGSLGWTFRQRQRRQRISVRSRFADFVGFGKRILMGFRALPASGVAEEDRPPSRTVGCPEGRRTPEAGNVAERLGVTPSRSDRRFGARAITRVALLAAGGRALALDRPTLPKLGKANRASTMRFH